MQIQRLQNRCEWVLKWYSFTCTLLSESKSAQYTKNDDSLHQNSNRSLCRFSTLKCDMHFLTCIYSSTPWAWDSLLSDLQFQLQILKIRLGIPLLNTVAVDKLYRPMSRSYKQRELNIFPTLIRAVPWKPTFQRHILSRIGIYFEIADYTWKYQTVFIEQHKQNEVISKYSATGIFVMDNEI